MLFAIHCKDKPDSLNVRLETRAIHVDYLNGLNAAGKLKMAGPLLDDGGKPLGSLILLDVADKKAAQAIAEADPYARAGLFQSVEIRGFNWVFNNPDS